MSTKNIYTFLLSLDFFDSHSFRFLVYTVGSRYKTPRGHTHVYYYITRRRRRPTDRQRWNGGSGRSSTAAAPCGRGRQKVLRLRAKTPVRARRRRRIPTRIGSVSDEDLVARISHFAAFHRLAVFVRFYRSCACAHTTLYAFNLRA